MIPDGELLRRYADDGSESAFAELVQRHINVVYRAALRRVGGNAHAADDVTQRVFTDLARKAKSLKDRPNLGGWLYTGTRFASAELVRSEQRRRTHEQEAQAMHELDSPNPASAGKLDPVLDEVMDLLEERDREAVLLHFFEGQTFSEVGSLLKLSADAARMRVNRALDRLRGELSRRGVASTSAALATLLSTQTGASAPASLASTVAGRALAQAAVGSAGGGAVIQWIRSILASKAAPAAVAVVAVGTAVVFLAPRDRPPPPVPAIQNPSAPAVQTAAANEPRMEFSPIENVAPVITVSTPATAFAQLDENEKMLLKQLAAMREFFGTPPDRTIGFVFPEEAPGYPAFFQGREKLMEKGLVDTGPNKGARMTKAGYDFIDAHLDEIDAYDRLFKDPSLLTPLPAATGTPGTFTALTAPEKDLLKKLWTIEAARPSQPGLRNSFSVAPAAPAYSRFIEGRDLLIEKGLVALGVQRGFPFLTPAGIALCKANNDEIDGYPQFYKTATPAANP